MQQEPYTNSLQQLAGILSGDAKPPSGESAEQFAFVHFHQLVQETKGLTEDQLLTLSQLAPRYVSFAITQPKHILFPCYQALETVIQARLLPDQQVRFYLSMAEQCAERGWWLNSHPSALKDMDVLYYFTRGVSLAGDAPFAAIGHRLYQHDLQTIAAEVHQQAWPTEKNRFMTECQRVAELKTPFNAVHHFSQQLTAVMQRFTRISSAERAGVWRQWAVLWYTQQEEIDHKATEEGDSVCRRFQLAILDFLNPENKHAADDLKPLCQQQRQMITDMARYGERDKARWQLHRYYVTLKETQKKLDLSAGPYYRRTAEEKPRWLAVVTAMIAEGHALSTTLETLPSGFPQQPLEPISQQWLTWRQRFQQLERTALPTPDQIPAALRHNAQQARALWLDILVGCVDWLGPPPCPFAWIPIGSLARDEMLLGSDIDGLILIDHKDFQQAPYFTALLHLLWSHGLLLPSAIFPLEHQDFESMLKAPPEDNPQLHCRLLNTPEALAAHFWRLIDADSETDNLMFGLGFPGALIDEKPPATEIIRHTLWQYQEALLSRYQRALAKVLVRESSRQLARWVMQKFLIKKDNPSLAQFKTLSEQKTDLGLKLKEDLLRPLTWWCITMKLAYALPDTLHSSHEILSALQERAIFPRPWLQRLQQWESQVHAWRWQHYQPTSPELLVAFRDIYCVLDFSHSAWLSADEKQSPPAEFDPQQAMIHTLMAALLMTPTNATLASQKDHVWLLARVSHDWDAAMHFYSRLPNPWRGYFVDQFLHATSAVAADAQSNFQHRMHTSAHFLGKAEGENKEVVSSSHASPSAEVAVLTQWAEELTAQLPQPPCHFWSFVLPHSGQLNHFILGMAVADEKLTHDAYFSHWAELFAECVTIRSARRYQIDISRVSQFIGATALPSTDLLGTTAQLAVRASSLAATLTPVTPLRWLSREEKPILLLHHRPRHWQRELLALTRESPDGKETKETKEKKAAHVTKSTAEAKAKEAEKLSEPMAQLSWPEAKIVRYLSPALTRRLFHTQGKDAGKLASAQRSATPGQSDVWRLTAADASEVLPECSSDTIIAYLKTHPAHLWRQWQHLALAKRIIDVGYTGTIATVQYDAKSEPIPVWLSSPAGVTFCSIADHKDSASSSDVQVIDEKGQARLAQYAAQLDPHAFTQLVLLTYLLVHEDDQLRNLGWQVFINTRGATVFRIIPFDTDTCLVPPWIRMSNGQVQIQLKSLVFCLEAMQQPLDPTTIQAFLALDPITVLEDWLKEIKEANVADNHLPADALEALYGRWQQAWQVLQLPLESVDPLAPTFPRTHLDWLALVDPVLGHAYQQAHQQHKDPMMRFQNIAQDYVMLGEMRLSRRSGVLRGASVAVLSRAVPPSSFNLKPQQALARCEQYRQQHREVKPIVDYLLQQAKNSSPIFERQITHVVGDMPKLNHKTQERMEQHQCQQHELEQAITRARQWEPLTTPDLAITFMVLDNKDNKESKDSKAPQPLAEWQATCARTAQPGLRFVKNVDNANWQVYAHNGNYLVINGQPVDQVPENKEAWDLRPWQKLLTAQPNLVALRSACQTLHQTTLTQIEKLQRPLQETEAALQELAKQRQARMSRSARSDAKSLASLPPTSAPDFLLGLQDLLLRRAVLSQLPWGQMLAGPGLTQLLRLLELGGLVELNLQDCAAVTEAQVLACVQNSPELMRLNLSGCINITDSTLVQVASQARSLTRLAARGLPKVKELWRGILWVAHDPLHFPQLTHADFRGCKNLRSLHLQAPALQYLHLGDCGSPESQEWILKTPQLKVLNISHCQFSRLNIQSDALETVDVSGSDSLTLPILKAMLDQEQWVNLRLIIDGCGQLSEWQLLSRYPFLTPLAKEWMNTDILSALHSIFIHPDIAPDFVRLPAAGRWRLQLGLVLFFWQTPRKLFQRVLKLLAENSDNTFREHTLRTISQIGTTQVKSASRALSACLPYLKFDWRWVSPTAMEVVGQIGAIHASLANKVFTACQTELKKFSCSDVSRGAVEVLGQIGAVHANLSGQAFTACHQVLLTCLSYPKPSMMHFAAVMAIGQIGAAHANLADRALSVCLTKLKDLDANLANPALSDSFDYYGVLRAISQIGAVHTNLADQALNTCLLYLNSDYDRCSYALEPIGQIGAAHVNLADRALTACLPYLKKGRNEALKAVGQIGAAHTNLADQALTACLPYLNSSWQFERATVLTIIGQIGATHANLADRALTTCLHYLKYVEVSESVLNAIGQIGAAHTNLADRALTACLYYLKYLKYRVVREDVLNTIGQIGAAHAFTVCLPYLKDFQSEVRHAAVKAIGRIGAAQVNLATQAFTACLPLLEEKERKVHFAAAKSISALIATQSKLIYPLLRKMSDLLQNPDKSIVLNTIHLFVNVSAKYHVQLEQSLDDYISHFLQQWFRQYPAESKSVLSAQDSKSSDEKNSSSSAMDPSKFEAKQKPSTTEGQSSATSITSHSSSLIQQPDASDSRLSGGGQSKNSLAMSGSSASDEKKKEVSTIPETLKSPEHPAPPKTPEADAKYLVGVLPNSKKEFKALEKPVPKDGNCGFTVLKTTRQKIFNMLMTRIHDRESRQSISAEIQEFCQTELLDLIADTLGAQDYKQLRDLDKYRSAVATAEQKFNAKKDAVNQLLAQQLENSAYVEDKESPLVNRLCQRLEFYKPANYLTLMGEIKQLHGNIDAAQQQYQAELESEATFRAYANAYLIDGDRPKLWLGYHTALLYAQYKPGRKMNVYIWKKTAPDSKQIYCQAPFFYYAGEGCETFHILHTDRYTHYNILEPADTAKLSQMHFIAQASAPKPAISLSSSSSSSSSSRLHNPVSHSS